MKLKKILVVLGLMTMLVGTVGCKKDEPKQEVQKESVKKEENPEKREESENVEGAEVADTEIPANQNLLTGVGDLSEGAIGKRPVAVMVNNVNAALPQYGIAKADIIFETVVEADLTRLMAIYADYTQVPAVCAVRSCRDYFPAISEGFDAIYVHWGMDSSIKEYVKEISPDKFDAFENPSGLFGRDQNRLNSGYALEHTGYFDGTKFASVTEQLGTRTDLLDNKKGSAFIFGDSEEKIIPNGNPCTYAKVEFGSATAEFEYDETSNTYLKKINGNNQMDSVEGTQLSFTNVFLLETDISIAPNGVHKQINWKGGPDAKGYYISNGAVQEIHWSKEDEKSYLKFYDENGKELVINRGKSYIALNYADRTTLK